MPADLETGVDVDLLCPQCEYNLRGLTENRCPECGAGFDPAELARRYSLAPAPALPDSRGSLLRDFPVIWRRALFSPGELARCFPRRHLRGPAIGYVLVCMAASLACLAGGAVLSQGFSAGGIAEGLAISMFIAVFFFFACLIWMVLAGGVLRWFAPVVGVPEIGHFWTGLVQLTSGYMVVAALWWAAWTVVSRRLPPGSFHTAGVLIELSGAAVGAWWVGALVRMAFVRGRPGSLRWVGVVLLLLIAAGLTAVALPLGVLSMPGQGIDD